MLGGGRDKAQTNAYIERNLKHWTDYGFGLLFRAWMSDFPVRI